MSKTKKIIYWIATLWLSLGMVSTGIGQLCSMKNGAGGADWITQLGFPLYLMTLLGTAKILGVIAILVPRFPLLKEWAYAGFFFIVAGAMYSHIASGDSSIRLIPLLLLLVLLATSWYFRPDDRKIIFSGKKDL